MPDNLLTAYTIRITAEQQAAATELIARFSAAAQAGGLETGAIEPDELAMLLRYTVAVQEAEALDWSRRLVTRWRAHADSWQHTAAQRSQAAAVVDAAEGDPSEYRAAAALAEATATTWRRAADELAQALATLRY